MRAEEFQNRAMGGTLRHRGAQTIGRKARQRQKAVCPCCVRKNPGERRKRHAGGILHRIFRPVKNCQPSVKQIRVVQASRGPGARGRND